MRRLSGVGVVPASLQTGAKASGQILPEPGRFALAVDVPPGSDGRRFSPAAAERAGRAEAFGAQRSVHLRQRVARGIAGFRARHAERSGAMQLALAGVGQQMADESLAQRPLCVGLVHDGQEQQLIRKRGAAGIQPPVRAAALVGQRLEPADFPLGDGDRRRLAVDEAPPGVGIGCEALRQLAQRGAFRIGR